MRSRHWICLTVLLGLLLSPILALAQPLADRVPDDALIYIAWRGVDNPADGYAGSRLKGFLDASAVPQLVNELFPKLLAKIAEKDPGAAMFADVVSKLGPSFWRNPTALYVGPVDGVNNFPMPRIALLCQAGAGAAQLKKDVDNLLKQIPPEVPIPIATVEENGVFGLLVGNVLLDLGGKGQATIAHRKEFTEAMAQVGKDPMMVEYVDLEAIVKLVDQLTATYNPQGAMKWQAIRDMIGLQSLKRIAVTAGFDGRDWSTQCFISAPSPRTGIMQLLDAGELSDDALRVAPQSSTMVVAGKTDLAKLLTTARGTLSHIDPSAPAGLDSALAMGSAVLGLNIEKDLIQPLGEDWVVYSAPTIGGVGPFGLVMVNHARDAAKLEQSLTTLETFINSKINSETARGNPRGNFVQAKVDGVNVHYMNTPFLSPGWAVKNGNLYIALFPQTVAAAANSAGGKSILENEDFVAMRKRLGGEKASAISFFDLPRTAPVGYPYLLIASRVLGFADMFGLQTPAAVLPPIDKLSALLSPAASATWTDATGVHIKNVSPFPGSTLLGGPEVLLFDGSAAIIPAFVMPYMARARAAEAHVAQPASPAPPKQ